MAGMDVFNDLKVDMIIHLRRRQYFPDKKKEREELKRQRESASYYSGGEYGVFLKITRIETRKCVMTVHCEDRWNRMYQINTDSFNEPSRIEITRHDDFPPTREVLVDATGGEFERIQARLEDYAKLVDFIDSFYPQTLDRVSGDGVTHAELAIGLIKALADGSSMKEGDLESKLCCG